MAKDGGPKPGEEAPSSVVSIAVLPSPRLIFPPRAQYPDYPGFQPLAQEYLRRMTSLTTEFLGYVAASLSLPGDTFAPFLGTMHRIKLIKYPAAPAGAIGVGPHKDSTGLFTFLSQDSVGGLQVLAKTGEWIDAPPMPGSLVVNVQQGFEAVTGGVCPATTHRVIVSHTNTHTHPHTHTYTPATHDVGSCSFFDHGTYDDAQSPRSTTRYSIPFFQGVNYSLTLDSLRSSAAHIVSKIPVSDDAKKRAVDVPSEFLSPLYADVSLFLSFLPWPLSVVLWEKRGIKQRVFRSLERPGCGTAS